MDEQTQFMVSDKIDSQDSREVQGLSVFIRKLQMCPRGVLRINKHEPVEER